MTGGKTEQKGKWLANIQRELYFFPADEGEFYVTKLLIFIFFQSCQRAWEHESQSDPQQDRPGGSRTAGRGFSQATFSCHAHNTIKKYSWI